jgi:hypothetical protein
MADGKPILVTGGHRSGTGWVGQMMAAGPDPLAYLWEPFSILSRPGICDARFDRWFPYICAANGDAYIRPIADMLAFRYKTWAELAAARSAKDVARLVRDRRRFARFRRLGARPLMKDPIALFSSAWIADTFDAEVVVLIRHPGAFVYSIKRLEWRHPFGDFLAQPLLMRDVLWPYADEIEAFAGEERPPFEQGILLWKLIHHAIAQLRERERDWHFRRLEDLALDPQRAFADLYGRLGLRFTRDVARTIDAHTRSGNPDVATRLDDVRRDSRASVAAWRSRLTPDEIRRIRNGVEPVASQFYADEDW